MSVLNYGRLERWENTPHLVPNDYADMNRDALDHWHKCKQFIKIYWCPIKL